jgi:hypothetical protein
MGLMVAEANVISHAEEGLHFDSISIKTSDIFQILFTSNAIF